MIAREAGCSERHLRRLIKELVARAYLCAEKTTFKSLTAAQRALGLPEPDRDDEGRAPDLLTLLVGGELACGFDYPQRSKRPLFIVQDKPIRDKPLPGIVRTRPQGRVVLGEPRTISDDRPPDKMADDLLGSTLLTRKVEGDPDEQPRPSLVVEEEKNIAAQTNSTMSSDEPLNLDAWRALNAAYDKHYRRVYHGCPTQKRVSSAEAQEMTMHIVDLAARFEAQLRERRVAVECLASPPLHMLANEALRSWFDSPGANGFLRRVSHPMKMLVADLPYRARKAIETLVEAHAPKPEPRKGLAPLVAMGVRGHVVRDKLVPMKLPMPMIHDMHADVVRRAEPPPKRPTISLETQQILDGLSARPALREFGTNVQFATELAALARERDMGSAHVLRALDGLAHVAERMRASTVQARKNAAFVAAVRSFGEANVSNTGGAP